MKVSESTQRHAGVALLRRVLGPLVLVIAVITAVATVTGGTGGSATTLPPTAGAPSGSPTPSSTTTSAAPSADSSGTPGVDAPGVLMTVTPRADGDLAVLETLWLPEPVDELRLSPPDLSAAGALFDGTRPRLTELALAADGRPVPLEQTTITKAVTVDLPAAAVTYTVRYTLQNAVVRSQPSVAGRALGVVRPLTLIDRPTLPVTVETTGDAVLSVSCPELGMAVTDCAAPTDDGYALTTPIRADRALVLLQLDLERV